MSPTPLSYVAPEIPKYGEMGIRITWSWLFDSKAESALSCHDRGRVGALCRFRNLVEQERRHSKIKVRMLRDSVVFAVIAIQRRLHLHPGDRNVTVDPGDRV